MASRKRFLLSLAGTVLFLFLVVALATAAVHREGTLEVDIRGGGPHGERFSVQIPGLFVRGALTLLPSRAFTCNLDPDAEPWLEFAHRLAVELDRIPDVTLVEVEGRHERVFIRKEGADLIVDVEDRDESVHISIPLSTVRAVVGKLEPARDAI